MLDPIHGPARPEFSQMTFAKANEYSKKKAQDTLSSAKNDESGCTKAFLWPFRAVYSFFSWLFSTICCCCSKTVEKTRIELVKTLQPELKELQDFYEKASNRSTAKFKRAWKDKFDKLPQQLQKMILEQGVLSSYKGVDEDLSDKEWLEKHFEENYKEDAYDYIVKLIPNKEVEKIGGKKKARIDDPTKNNDISDCLKKVNKNLEKEVELKRKKS